MASAVTSWKHCCLFTYLLNVRSGRLVPYKVQPDKHKIDQQVFRYTFNPIEIHHSEFIASVYCSRAFRRRIITICTHGDYHSRYRRDCSDRGNYSVGFAATEDSKTELASKLDDSNYARTIQPSPSRGDCWGLPERRNTQDRATPLQTRCDHGGVGR